MTREEIRVARRERLSRANPALLFFAGVAIGTGMAYLLDRQQGNRRRAVARDKAWSAVRHSGTLAGKTLRHLRNRLQGVASGIAHTITEPGVVSDRKLSDRIRSTIGRTIPSPHSVDIAVHDGRVTLRGVLKPHETGCLLEAIEKIPGVRSVDNQVLDTAPTQSPVQ
jgi:osmotically-inducible protein OsmY